MAVSERELLVRIVADDRVLQQAFTRSSRNTKAFGGEVDKATRGALAGTGVFHSFGRSIAFASGGFLAFASAGQFLRKSIDASRDAQVVQKQLAAQFTASGQNLSQYQAQIDKTSNSLSLLAGFNNDEVKAAFTTIFRTTRNVNTALRDTATAADLARAKNISLNQAAVILAKTEAGNTTLLRRQGIAIKQNATSQEALATLRRVVAGQAAAGTTEQQKFGAVLHDTEEIIGSGILPVLNKYLAAGAVWLTQMNSTGKLQKDVNAITHDFAAVVSTAAGTVKTVDAVTGSFTHTLRSLADIWLLLKARTIAIKWGLIETGIAGVGAQAATASGEVGVFAAALTRLKALGPIAVAIALEIIPKSKKSIPGGLQGSGPGKFLSNIPILGGLNSQLLHAGDVADQFLGLLPKTATGQSARDVITQAAASGIDLRTGFRTGSRNDLTSLKRLGLAGAAGATDAATSRPPTLQGQFNVAELKLAVAQQTNNQKLVRAILEDEAAIVKQQEDSAKKLKDRTGFAQKLASIMDQIRGIDQADADASKQATQQAKDRAKAAREAAKAAREAAAAATTARQFRALGLDATGSPLTPGTKALRAELGNVSKAIEGTFLDTTKERSVLSKIRRVLSGGLGDVAKDVRSTIKQMLDDIDQQLKNQSTGPQTKFQKASTRKLLAGLGLDPSTEKALRARLSQLGPGGTIPNQGFGAFGVPFSDSGQPLQINLNVDGQKVASVVTPHQRRKRKQNPRQPRGFAGAR